MPGEKRLKAPLKQLNKSAYSDISSRVQTTREALEKDQEDLFRAATPKLVQKEKELSQLLKHYLSAEESFYRQKSRVSWVQEGDQTSAFFHRMMRARRLRNSMSILYTADGKKLTDSAEIQQELIRYYQNLLGRIDPPVIEKSVADIKFIIRHQVSSQQQHDLIAPVTPEEIKKIIFSLNSNKSPGPDGFTAEFFKRS